MIAEEDRGVDLGDQETAPATTGAPLTRRNLPSARRPQDRQAAQGEKAGSGGQRESVLGGGVGPNPESRGDLPISTVAVYRLAEAATASQDETGPTAVGASARRSRAPPATKAREGEPPPDQEAFLSLMAQLSLRAVRDALGRRGSEANEID
jgi:hypothetical protein